MEEKKKLVRLILTRDGDGIRAKYWKSPEFDKLFEPLRIQEADGGLKYRVIDDASERGLSQLVDFFMELGYDNSFYLTEGAYCAFRKGKPNIGLMRVIMEGREIEIKLAPCTTKELKEWCAKFVEAHKLLYREFIKKVVIKYELSAEEVL